VSATHSAKETGVATVLGYHGCQNDFADGVRAGRITLDQWKPSQNQYDWLGEGIYFWEASRSRAEQWARERFADGADVLAVEIELGQCLDLLETRYHEDLRATYQRLRRAYRKLGLSLPKNHAKLHDLDNLVIDRFVQAMAEKGIRFQTVRGVFEEGPRLFPGSVIRAQSHIQIAVRDIDCLRLRHEKGGE
jgi:hypothetical protein